MTEIRMNNIVTITPEAIDTYHECMTVIAEAYKWAQDPMNLSASGENAEEEWKHNNELVRDMERTFLSNWARLVCGPQMYDGPLTISRDGFCSFYWIYTNKSPAPGSKPYHGGLIPHRNHSVKNFDGIYSWSTHT